MKCVAFIVHRKKFCHIIVYGEKSFSVYFNDVFKHYEIDTGSCSIYSPTKLEFSKLCNIYANHVQGCVNKFSDYSRQLLKLGFQMCYAFSKLFT